MNKKYMRVLALTLAAALLLCACGSKPAPAEETSGAAQTEASTDVAGRELGLSEWSLSSSTWSSPNGATVHLTAVPTVHADGDSAMFVVRLEGEEIASVPCEWKDNTYTASADLNAADGYCYYVTLSGADGASVEVAVNTPAEPSNENLIDLASALESYCSLTLEESLFSDGTLTVYGGSALVQAPRITDNNENVACAQATLVLTLDGETMDSKALTMAPGEVERSYEASLENVSFSVPGEIGPDQLLALRLDAVLTNGQTLTAQGGSWYYLDGGLANAVG